MSLNLLCVQGAMSGRTLVVDDSKPLIIKTQKSNEDAGEIRVEFQDGMVVLTNRSRMICKVNGEPRQRTVLNHGDEIIIGKQIFHVAVGDNGNDTTTQHVIATGAASDPAMEEPFAFCSACDGVFDDEDRAQGWSRGDQRICRLCLSKGVKPDHLPRQAIPPADLPEDPPAAQVPPEDVPALPINRPAAAIPTPVRGAPTVTATSPKPAPPLPATSASPASRPAAGPEKLPTAASTPRRSKRISASRLAQVEPAPAPPSKGLLHMVGQVFGHKSEERRRLTSLEEERRDLLLEAGRASLNSDGGFGLPERLLAAIGQGEEVTLRLEDLTIVDFEHYRERRQRLALLDASIAGARRNLGIGAEAQQSVRMGTAPLPADQKVRQEETFKVLDGVGTERLDDASLERIADIELDEPAVPSAAPAVPAAAAARGARGAEAAAAVTAKMPQRLPPAAPASSRSSPPPPAAAASPRPTGEVAARSPTPATRKAGPPARPPGEGPGPAGPTPVAARPAAGQPAPPSNHPSRVPSAPMPAAPAAARAAKPQAGRDDRATDELTNTPETRAARSPSSERSPSSSSSSSRRRLIRRRR